MNTSTIASIRADFPILTSQVRGKDLVYLDNAATTLKPQVVIDRIHQHYEQETANVHRGVHYLSEVATAAYEETRSKLQTFLNASSTKEIIFTKGTTDSLNLLAYSFGSLISEGDEILISEMEHHSNIVPWQMLCERTGAVLKVIPINDDGELIWDEFLNLLSEKTKLVSILWVSNSLGTINPIKKIITEAHQRNIPVSIDAAQAITDFKIDVQDLNCDFFVFSGHKMFGPTGVGILYGKEEWLEKLPPYQGGGDMISSVTFEKTTYNQLPYKFEAGTPNIAGVIGLGAAIDYINDHDIPALEAHKQELLAYANQQLSTIDGLKLIGTAQEKTAVVSFVLDNVHAHDIGTLVDQHGVAIRTGHHCNQPIMKHFKVPATSRASFSWYNTKEEVDRLVTALNETIKLFQ